MELDSQTNGARDAGQQQSEQPHTADDDACSHISEIPIQVNGDSNAVKQSFQDHAAEDKESNKTNQDLEAALQEAVRADADSPGHSDIEMEDSNADLIQVANVDTKSDQQNSSIHSSPVLEDSQLNMISPIHDLPEAASVAEDVDAESDNYEPPEATPPANEILSVDSPPFSPAPPDSIIDEPGDIQLGEVSNSNPAELEVISDGVEQPLPVDNGSLSHLAEVKDSPVDPEYPSTDTASGTSSQGL